MPPLRLYNGTLGELRGYAAVSGAGAWYKRLCRPVRGVEGMAAGLAFRTISASGRRRPGCFSNKGWPLRGHENFAACGTRQLAHIETGEVVHNHPICHLRELPLSRPIPGVGRRLPRVASVHGSRTSTQILSLRGRVLAKHELTFQRE
jgi:hypothetical protein